MRYLPLLLVLFLCTCVRAQELYFPPLTGNAWATTSLEDAGFCTDGEQELYDYLEGTNTDAFILLKDGRIVIERYFGDFTASSPHLWNSAGKSLMSFTVGIAAEIDSVDLQAPTADYLGQGWTDCPESELETRVIHQLTMTSGLSDEVDDISCTSPECLQCFTGPGLRWAYHNSPYTLLGRVIEEATGQDLNDFVGERIRQKTGMTGQYIPLGNNRVFASTARSMARFGLLMQGGGTWNGTPVLSDTAYFNAMINTSQDLNPAYGYLWWLNGKSSYQLPQSQVSFSGSIAPNAPDDTYAAIGKNGQIINIVPSEGLVFIRMGSGTDGSLVPTVYLNNLWERINALRCTTSATDPGSENDKLTVFPNPATNDIVVRSPTPLRRVTFFADGRRHRSVALSGHQQTVSLAGLPQGVLNLRIMTSDGSVSWRRVVRRR